MVRAFPQYDGLLFVNDLYDALTLNKAKIFLQLRLVVFKSYGEQNSP